MFTLTNMWRIALMLNVLHSFGPGFTAGALPKTAKNLNDSAALSCNVSCPGVVQWWRDGEKVSECGPGARSDLRFNCTVNKWETKVFIPQVNHSTRGNYSVHCGDREMFHCRQFLQVLTPESVVDVEAGKNLRLDLFILQPVTVDFRRSGNSSTVELCRVTGRDYECLPEYQDRVLIIRNVFILLNTVPSDSGRYTVQEKDDGPVSISYITVREVRSSGNGGYWNGIGHGALVSGVVVLIVVFLVVYVWPRLCYQINMKRRGSNPAVQTPDESDDKGNQDGLL